MAGYYIDINDSYNVTDPLHNGTVTYPFCYDECDTLVGGVAVNGVTLVSGDTLYLRGRAVNYALFNDVQMSLIIKSWPGRIPWELDGRANSTGCYFTVVNAGDTLDIYDGIFTGIQAEGANSGSIIAFYNCFTWTVYLNSYDTDEQNIYRFSLCTIAGDVHLRGDHIVGGGEVYFKDCVGIDFTISDLDLWNVVEFENTNIFNRSQADMNNLDGTTTETGWDSCTFSYALAADVIDYIDFFNADTDISDFDYLQFELPLVFSQPSRWDTLLLSQGWYDKYRYGYGAFYFTFGTNIAASPEYGTAPLTVQFTANATDGVVDENNGYLWDFGDGAQTTEKDPTHTFIPGVYEVSVTITALWGEEVTEYLTVYVYENDYSANGRNVTKTTKIYRFAVPQENKQGKGWSEYEGDEYPKAIGLVGACKIMTDEDEERVIVTDCSSFKHYWLGKEDHWQDGGNDDYGGTEINSDILFRELVPPIQATAKLKHSETEVNIKPWLKNRRDTGDYNRYGFRNAFNSSIYFREDSKNTDRAEVKYFPRKAQIVSDRHIESESVQTGLRITGAPWRLARIQQWNEQIDTAAAPPEKQMSEKTWGEMLKNTIIWVGRSRDLINPASGAHTLPWDTGSGQRTTGQFAGVATGPDGNNRSAIIFGSSDFIQTVQNIASGDLSIILWVKSLASSNDICEATDFKVSIYDDGIDKSVKWEDNTDNVSIALNNIISTDWNMIVFVRESLTLRIYLNGILINTRILISSNSYSGPVIFYNNSLHGFEPRIIQYALTDNAVKWLYDDVIENNGNSTCGEY